MVLALFDEIGFGAQVDDSADALVILADSAANDEAVNGCTSIPLEKSELMQLD
jgi:hypothetical protein